MCYSDKYGNIWKERPIKPVGIHNKQDNWKLPVKKDPTEYKAAGPFYKKNKSSWFS